MTRNFIAAIRLLLFVVLTLPMAALQWIVLAGGGKKAAPFAIPQRWHRLMCRVFGLRTAIAGTPAGNGQTIFVVNHVSYLDIPVLAHVLKASFIAKKDVETWPVFGPLARLQKTAFIDRSPQTVRSGSSRIRTMIENGSNIILFPEGTSSDGRNVLPFKTSLFGAVLGGLDTSGVQIQPVTLRLEDATTQADRDLYAWYGEMTLLPHLLRFAKGRGAKITLVFHPSYAAGTFTDRKKMAEACREAIRYGLETGRPEDPHARLPLIKR